MLTFEEWRHTYADVFETDDAARAAWTAASNKGYSAGVQDTRELLAARDGQSAGVPVAWLHADDPRDAISDAKKRDMIEHNGIPGKRAAERYSIACFAAPAPTLGEQHTDDLAVDSFARAMKKKMAVARAKGRCGWEGTDPAELSRMLREHIEMGDPRDVANFCMMLWHHSSLIVSQPQAAEPKGYGGSCEDCKWSAISGGGLCDGCARPS